MPTVNTGIANAIHIPVDIGRLDGTFFLPEGACGLVLFADGSGAGHNTQNNLSIAEHLHAHAIGTLLFDLLTPVEDGLYRNRFDIALLSRRLCLATAWAHGIDNVSALPIGYLGSGTGAAAAVRAAAESGGSICAVVSRGGRPDLAGDSTLASLVTPTLLLVGGREPSVIALNRDAYAKIGCGKQLRVIPGARNLFEEPGALAQVAQQATAWFEKYFTSPPALSTEAKREPKR